MSCPELSKTKPKEIPKSILKKKSQFDQNSNSDKESYPRVKPVKSIRFSLDVSKRTNYTRTPSNASLGLKSNKKKECQGKKEKKRRRKADVDRKVEEIARQDKSEPKKPFHESKSKEKLAEFSELVGRGEEDEIKSKKGRRNEYSLNPLQKDKQTEGSVFAENQENPKERCFKEIPKKEEISPRIVVEEGKQNKIEQEKREGSLTENSETKRKRRQRRGRRRKKRKGKERE